MAGSPKHITKTPEPRTNPPLPVKLQIKIDEVLVKLEDNGASEFTIKEIKKDLTKFAKNTNIDSPDEIKTYIKKLQVSDPYKARLCTSYGAYCRHHKLFWEKPHYNRESKNFKVPTTQRIDQLIASCHSQKLALMLRISKHGLRPIEVTRLTPENIDFDQNTISPVTAKKGAPRTLKIEQLLTDSLKQFINDHKIKPKQRLFPIASRSFSHEFQLVRNRIAQNTNDQTIKQIRLYDFRHHFGTETYRKTQSVPFTAYQLGHRSWKNTKVYVDLEAILNQCEEDYDVAIATTKEEAIKLLTKGYVYQNLEYDGAKLFKKRK